MRKKSTAGRRACRRLTWRCCHKPSFVLTSRNTCYQPIPWIWSSSFHYKTGRSGDTQAVHEGFIVFLSLGALSAGQGENG